ncbi:DNA-3-methyladenine glycosylase I [Tomitella cavernea]|uniref:DNA-3-methyladenine glycosylase I n=1 Tax=Tomitella cavernea TaxID=1387982 RepID=A0ABP9C2R7_9ACTN|nr:DNA-3-methyladenine glycosylase I [Tomitella cavernea]
MPETTAIVGADGVARCPWAVTDPLNTQYHDTEWGVPVHGEQPLFERICLESFQAGLSWLTILRKRPAFRGAFAGFEVDRVAAFTDDDVQRLLADSAIVRNRAKIEAAVGNARAVQRLRDAEGLDAMLWDYRDADPAAPRTVEEVPTRSAASESMAKDLRARGFRFVGPTSCHALMEATGIINTHLVDCHRRGISADCASSRRT